MSATGYAWPDLARQVLDVYRQVTGPGRGGGSRPPNGSRQAPGTGR